MAFILGERYQTQLLPASIEDYIAPEDPVRVYDAFVERLDFLELGIDLNPNQAGPPEFDPKAMVKFLVYGYAYGVRSSRKLERAAHHNLSFIWLLGGLKPDHKTIARFRRTHREALKKVLKQCVRLCLGLGLIAGNTLFVDGTKLRGNASLKQSWSKKKCDEVLRRTDRRIERLLAECEAVDAAENDADSLVQLKQDLANAQNMKQKVHEIMAELAATQAPTLNTTDSECATLKGKQGTGTIVGYNVQSVVDEKHGLIVHTDVVTDGNDLGQFEEQITQAQQATNRKCAVACGDSGYANITPLKAVHEQNVKVIVPPAVNTHATAGGAFAKDRFAYDRENDTYRCPAGHTLRYRKSKAEARQRVYQITQARICRRCPHFGVCTKAKGGRSLVRLFDEELKEQLEAQYREPSSKAIYRLRKQKVELPFGHIKRNMGVQSFLLRGLKGVRAEASLLASAFNLTRIVNLLGVTQVIHQLAWA